MSRGMPVGKQLATVGSKSTRPFVILGWPGSVFLLAIHLASAQDWKEGSSLGLKVADDSVMFAQTPVRSGAWAAGLLVFAPDDPAVCARITGEKASTVSIARIEAIHRFRMYRHSLVWRLEPLRRC